MPTDVLKADHAPADRPVGPASAVSADRPAPMYDLIELFFFAYRDFIGDADRLLETYGFGRAHHRVIYFVTRRPGLTIAELLEILRITKQSLNRVLRELLDKNFIDARAGAMDRRRRQLYATPDGERLAVRLAEVQTKRFSAALAKLDDSAATAAASFLQAMMDPQDRERSARGHDGGAA
jgi:DNA-binding MarR family transcriptional regulator